MLGPWSKRALAWRAPAAAPSKMVLIGEPPVEPADAAYAAEYEAAVEYLLGPPHPEQVTLPADKGSSPGIVTARMTERSMEERKVASAASTRVPFPAGPAGGYYVDGTIPGCNSVSDSRLLQA